eukprot:GILJ01007172.1.p1 GENE.GILJ01007172.1~~GILJ01007172.1.p1  ORF type:complete len:666 (+),score=82.46 GILJ01007172.1:34-2031(+)
MSMKTLLLSILLLSCSVQCRSVGTHDVLLDKAINSLVTRITASQITKDSHYSSVLGLFPPLTWERQKGLYPSSVHFNFHGNRLMKALRDRVRVPDDNAFVAMSVTQFLLEALEFHPELYEKVTETQISSSIAAIISHRDQNREKGVPLYMFWRQKFINSTWSSWPTNLAVPLTNESNVAEAIRKLALRVCPNPKLLDVLKALVSVPKFIVNMFHIPADFDDTGCAIGLGVRLALLHGITFPTAAKHWQEASSNMNEFAAAVKKYAYRPFSNGSHANVIDPRTYLWLRNFLYEQEAESSRRGANPSVALVTTWVLNAEENRLNVLNQLPYWMPFNVNNVDASVVANNLFGIVSALLLEHTGAPVEWFDDDMNQIVADSAKLLAWILNTNALANRPDLVLLYYPSAFDFYFFVARLCHLLRFPPVYVDGDTAFQRVARSLIDILHDPLKVHGTQQLLSRAIVDDSFAYWDDIIGGGDNRFAHDDRFFSTAMAVNALLDIWTATVPCTHSPFKCKMRRTWDKGASETIRNIVERGVLWLSTVFKHTSRQNAFFSGSVKSDRGEPFIFPSNYMQTLSGDKLDCNSSLSNPSRVVIGVSGMIARDDYSLLLNSTCFGKSVPTVDPGFNCPSCTAPYWSSETLADAAALLALTKWSALKLDSSLFNDVEAK